MEQFQQDIAYFPFLVTEQGDFDTPETIKQNLKIFRTLSAKEQDILTARELPGILWNIQQDFHLDRNSILQLSRLIRWFFYKKLSWNEFGVRIESLLLASQGNNSQVGPLMERIRKDVIELVPQPVPDESESREEASAPQNLVRLPLLKALSEYPQMHGQRITQEKIRITSERDPAAPTVRNWLRAYRDALGVGKHNAMDRGKFLFQSENSKHLAPEERERVSVILKSLDENDPVTVNPSRQEIIFPKTSEDSAPVPQQPLSHSTLPISRISPVGGAAPAARPPKDLFEQFVPAPHPHRVASSQQQPAERHEAMPQGSFQFSTGHVLPGEQARMSADPPDTSDPQELVNRMLRQKRFARPGRPEDTN